MPVCGFVHSRDTQGETSFNMLKNEARAGGKLLLLLVALSGASGLAPTFEHGTPFLLRAARVWHPARPLP
jgi:hypothetical protein